ncbi:MAG TPA: ATP-binding cassette domain-containing protein, partial [Chitinophagaceae bacterium]|nr:ATP-binding cassette domain-containing protein [Chitinophagaceae bacterium]
IEIINLETAAKKQMRYYSSGMKQRVKLAQAIFSETTILLLDEPCSNLDIAGIELYHHLIKNYTAGRLVMVSSNDQIEYSFCDEKLSINDFKK